MSIMDLSGQRSWDLSIFSILVDMLTTPLLSLSLSLCLCLSLSLITCASSCVCMCVFFWRMTTQNQRRQNNSLGDLVRVLLL
jgi:peptidoglycan biosynthesis protein MviN/MurJ (putative lipid II flippase)